MRVCMLVYSFYESDSRVRMYGDALQRHGHDVDVICLRKTGEEKRGELNNVQIYRIQERDYNEKGKLDYFIRLMIFLFKSAIMVTRLHLKKRYSVIHVHSVPDYEVFAAIIPKLLGAKIILDIHDIVPEFFASKFKVPMNSLIPRVLIRIERLCCAFSNHVIIANDIWYDRITKRSLKKEKCTSIINYPDPHLFNTNVLKETNAKKVFMYPGTINAHQGVDIAVKAFALAKDQLADAEFHIYGKGPELNNILNLIKDLNLEQVVFYKGWLSTDQILLKMASAFCAVVPKRSDDFGDEAFSTKIMEFMALGVPIIASNTRIDKYYFNDTLIQFFESGNEKDLSNKMSLIFQNPTVRQTAITNGLKFIEENNWTVKQKLYFNIINSFQGRKDPPA